MEPGPIIIVLYLIGVGWLGSERHLEAGRHEESASGYSMLRYGYDAYIIMGLEGGAIWSRFIKSACSDVTLDT